jgi:RNA polymerase sigma-70 factor, ECF subfamily
MSTEMTVRLPAGDAWLEDFYAGRRATMADVYHDHFETVAAVVGRVVAGADKETIIHEVFLKLLSSPEHRRRFQGGSFSAWIATVARNQAIDHARRASRELLTDGVGEHVASSDQPDEAATAHVLIERFRTELPENWRLVFDLCFLRQIPQRDAAARLGVTRTTLAYQYHQIRIRLRRFVLSRTEAP